MRSLARFLESEGYPVLNVDYPSTRIPLESLIEHINKQVVAFNQDHQRRIHFVGYSLGGLMARGVINRYRPPNLGRVVQLAPPNQGSEVADFWKNNFLYRWIFGPAGQDLGADEKSFNRILGPVDYELGVIADHIVIPATHTFIIYDREAWNQAVHFFRYGKFNRINTA
jgi:hypothetical protein